VRKIRANLKRTKIWGETLLPLLVGIDYDPEKATILKLLLLLYIFELMSGLKINFTKIEFFTTGGR
jgi:hypothetical protein